MRGALFVLVAVGVLLLAAAGLGVPLTVPLTIAAHIAWTLLRATAPAIVWGLAGGLGAGVAAFVVEQMASILAMFTYLAWLGSTDPSPAGAVALAVVSQLAAPVLGSYAAGGVMAYRATGPMTLRRGFVAGALAELARLLASVGLDAGSTPAAVISMLWFALPVLLVAAPVVGLAGAAGAWAGSSARRARRPVQPPHDRFRGRRPVIVAWSGSLLVVLALVWLGSNLHGAVATSRTGLAPGVTRDGIRAVRIGMTREEVEAILGPPMSSERTPYRERGVTLTYSRPMSFARWYPMLWIHLLEGRVISVYAKRYILWGMDDIGVYGLGAEGRWEAREFEATFQR